MSLLLNGKTNEVDETGKTIIGDSLFLCFNAHYEAIEFSCPNLGKPWEALLCTYRGDGQVAFLDESKLKVEGRSLVLLKNSSLRG